MKKHSRQKNRILKYCQTWLDGVISFELLHSVSLESTITATSISSLASGIEEISLPLTSHASTTSVRSSTIIVTSLSSEEHSSSQSLALIQPISHHQETSLPSTSAETSTQNSTTKRGRKRKHYSDLQPSAKRIRVNEIRSRYNQNLLIDSVLPQTLRANGYKKLEPCEMSAEDIEDKALAMMLDSKMTTSGYSDVRKYNKDIGNDNTFFPNLKRLKMAKDRCCPALNVTEDRASIKLQDLVDYTTRRLFKSLNIKISQEKYQMSWKWGMDGIGGFQKRNQKPSLTSSQSNEKFVQSIVVVAISPLELKKDDLVIWGNPKPSSHRYCRPVEFAFEKETTQYLQNRHRFYKTEIGDLVETNIGNCEIQHFFNCSMLDGKACNAITNVASSRSCGTCRATQSQLHDRNLVEFEEDEALEKGVPILHSWINFMTFILNNVYRRQLFDHTVSQTEKKELQKQYKESIQKKLYEEVGIIVDAVRQGSGTTNTGNTARIFFRNFQKVSEILGVEVSVIKGLYIVLQCITCLETLNAERFKTYCLELATNLEREFGPNCITPTVHKVLFHGWKMISNFSLPIGMYSEAAIEHLHQILKKAKVMYSRKMSQLLENTDIIRRMLIESDFVISKLRKNIPAEKLEMLDDCFQLFHSKLVLKIFY